MWPQSFLPDSEELKWAKKGGIRSLLGHPGMSRLTPSSALILLPQRVLFSCSQSLKELSQAVTSLCLKSSYTICKRKWEPAFKLKKHTQLLLVHNWPDFNNLTCLGISSQQCSISTRTTSAARTLPASLVSSSITTTPFHSIFSSPRLMPFPPAPSEASS